MKILIFYWNTDFSLTEDEKISLSFMERIRSWWQDPFWLCVTESVLLLGVHLLPSALPDFLSNAAVAFVCALQVETFRKVRGNAFASTMCTGNLRSGTEALYHGLVRRDRTALEKALCYYGIIGCFIAGAALGAFLTGPAPQRAVLGAAALQSAAFVLMWGRDASPA